MPKEKSHKGSPSEGYPLHLLGVEEFKECAEQMVEFRKWMIAFFPDSFPKGERTDFSLVIEKTKDLMTTYINLNYLLEG